MKTVKPRRSTKQTNLFCATCDTELDKYLECHCEDANLSVLDFKPDYSDPYGYRVGHYR